MRRLRTHLKNPRAWRLVGLVIVMLGTTGLVAAGPVVPPGVRAPLAALLAAFAYSVTLLPPAGRVIDHSARLVVVIPLGLSAITWLSHATDGDPAWAIVAGVAAVLSSKSMSRRECSYDSRYSATKTTTMIRYHRPRGPTL